MSRTLCQRKILGPGAKALGEVYKACAEATFEAIDKDTDKEDVDAVKEAMSSLFRAVKFLVVESGVAWTCGWIGQRLRSAPGLGSGMCSMISLSGPRRLRKFYLAVIEKTSKRKYTLVGGDKSLFCVVEDIWWLCARCSGVQQPWEYQQNQVQEGQC